MDELLKQLLKRLLIITLLAIPRICKRIVKYFKTTFEEYRNLQQEKVNSKDIILQEDSGEKETWQENFCRFGGINYPYAYLVWRIGIVPFVIFRVLWYLIPLILPFLIVGFFALALFLSWLEEQFPPPPDESLPQIENVSGTLTNWAYKVTLHLKGILPSPIRMPTGVSETEASPPIATFQGVKRFQFYIPILADKKDEALDLDDVKELLQSGFNNQLKENFLPEQPYYVNQFGEQVPKTSIDGEPIVTIADINRERLRLIVNAFWVNNSAMAANVKKWRGDCHANNNKESDVVDVTDRDY